MMSYIRRYFISGLLIWLPIWITILVVRFIIELLDNTMLLLPHQLRPDTIMGVHIPGVGLLITLGVILTTGLVVTNFLGKKIVSLGDKIVARIPLVRTIYSSVKQVIETILTPGGTSFRKVLLVEFPRVGMWSIAFQTGDSTPEVDRASRETDMISLFIPATPNPTSGFLMMVPRNQVIELDMTIEQALKFVISLGVMQPNMSSFNKK